MMMGESMVLGFGVVVCEKRGCMMENGLHRLAILRNSALPVILLWLAFSYREFAFTQTVFR